MLQAWSSYNKEVDVALIKYWALIENLSTEDGCKAYKGRWIIPPNLRKLCMY